MTAFDPFESFDSPSSPPVPKSLAKGVSEKLELSPFTRHIKELERRVPVVGDKALIDLISGIHVNGEIISYRKRRNFFGRLMDTLSGSDRKRELLVQGNLIEGQDTLRQWVLELSDSLNISLVGLEVTQKSLEVTQKSLLEARMAIRDQKQSLDELRRLIQSINTDLSDRIGKLEARVSANEDLDKIVEAWAAGKTYTNLPWAVQVALLAREVFSSSVILYELESRDTQFRDRLINKIIVETRYREVPKQFKGLDDLVDQMWKDIKGNQDHELLTNLLETYSVGLEQLMSTPHLFVVGKTLELSMLPPESRPNNPAACALALCQSQIGDVEEIETPNEFITAIIEETANSCSALISLPKNKRR